MRIPGDLATAAGMLACGEASAPALAILRRHDTRAIAISEAALAETPQILQTYGGPKTTPSGAAGLAGALLARDLPAFDLGENSRVLILVTEGASEDAE